MPVKRLLQIGITGGIGSGKSLVSKIFHSLGIAVYDSDSRAKSLMTTDGILVSHIKKEFGLLSYHEDGGLNRNYLAETVFNDPEKLNVLNKLVHPRVGEDYKHWLSEHEEDFYVLKEAALLFEAGSYEHLDRIIVVTAPAELRIKRVLERDTHRTDADVKAIINNQWSEEEKVSRADHVVLNDETTLVIPQVLALHSNFMLLAVDDTRHL
ncbi:MAG: dephospho-CoA kinase [Cyclobacteriaceae bacterium]|nr:dephospho-CoA kinase [Cyclobacteriaceae bacterium]